MDYASGGGGHTTWQETTVHEWIHRDLTVEGLVKVMDVPTYTEQIIQIASIVTSYIVANN